MSLFGSSFGITQNSGSFFGGSALFSGFGFGAKKSSRNTQYSQFVASNMTENVYRDWAIHQKKLRKIMMDSASPNVYALKKINQEKHL